MKEYLMESLDDFLNEAERRLNQEYTDNDKKDNILEEFGINPDELYYPTLKDSVYKMAREIYNLRMMGYVGSGWVNPN